MIAVLFFLALSFLINFEQVITLNGNNSIQNIVGNNQQAQQVVLQTDNQIVSNFLE